MKTYYYKYLIFVSFICLLISCKESLLDFQPKDRYTEGNFWQTETSANRYLNAAYSVLRSSGLYGGDATPLWEETASPNAYNKDNSDSWNSIASGTMTASTGGIIASRWSSSYQGIGRCNTILKRIENVSMSGSLKTRMKGEAHFLRALFYFNLENYYGDVPLILDPPDPSTQSKLPRTSRLEVVDQILSDIDSAINMLPPRYSGTDVGRATKGAAMALKAKVLLFEASPLFNIDKNDNKWKLASDAAKVLIERKEEFGYDLYPNYRTLFLPENENNQEVIFDVQFIFPRQGNSFDQIDRQFNNNAPVLGLIDAYEMSATGLPITDVNSGYDSNSPYDGRDPRFGMTIVYPGALYMGKIVTNTQFAMTGFGLKKYSVYDEEIPPSDKASLTGGQSETNYIVLRYADILLMYAESTNEFSGPDQSVYDAVNFVRNRSGMPNIPNNLSKDDMRKIIRHERRIEFAGEGYYYNDIRRWMIAENVLNADIFTYDNKSIQTRIFNPSRNYWWPIPQTERDLNTELDQNPNY